MLELTRTRSRQKPPNTEKAHRRPANRFRDVTLKPGLGSLTVKKMKVVLFSNSGILGFDGNFCSIYPVMLTRTEVLDPQGQGQALDLQPFKDL